MTKKILIASMLVCAIFYVACSSDESSTVEDTSLTNRGSSDFKEFDGLLEELFDGNDSVSTPEVLKDATGTLTMSRVYVVNPDKSLKLRGALIRDKANETKPYLMVDDNGVFKFHIYVEPDRFDVSSVDFTDNPTYQITGSIENAENRFWGWGPKRYGPCLNGRRYYYREYFQFWLMTDWEWIENPDGTLYSTPCSQGYDPYLGGVAN